ncbi:uncharacterized protein TNCV_2505391 [Trichonephila clavipes]|uniref:Uncharacterized protein n=1 Tax=Trichonephila clavipes TaxID=2585209 RepID=A0A8X6WHH4_TRICX|nr:uncharacterized protein TNCV_2505391 [Trichonephila clavipes]
MVAQAYEVRRRDSRDSLVVKVSDSGWHVTNSSSVPLKTHRVGDLCTLNLSRAQSSSRWRGVIVLRGVPAQVSSSFLDHSSKLRGPNVANCAPNASQAAK